MADFVHHTGPYATVLPTWGDVLAREWRLLRFLWVGYSLGGLGLYLAGRLWRRVTGHSVLPPSREG